jgi:hypothetical protein
MDWVMLTELALCWKFAQIDGPFGDESVNEEWGRWRLGAERRLHLARHDARSLASRLQRH